MCQLMEIPESSRLVEVSRRRKLAAKGLGFCAAFLRLRAAMRAAAERRHAVVLEPYGMGDIISTRPLVRGLRENGWSVDVATRPAWKELLDPSVGFVETALPWASYENLKKYGIARFRTPEFCGTLQRLRACAEGAVGLDPRGDIRNVILLYLAGCRKVISISNYMGADVFMPRWAARVVPSPPDERQWQIAQRLLGPLEIGGNYGPPRLPGAGELPAGRRVALLPAAPYAGRLWPAGRWRQVACHLSDLGWEVSGLCGPGQGGLAAEALGSHPVHEVAAIGEWKDQLQKFRVVIALDSGPMHLADALGVPLVALFGPGLLPRWAPNGPFARVVHHHSDPEFRPSHQTPENAPKDRIWMERITVEEVLEAFAQVDQALSAAQNSGKLYSADPA